MKSQLIFNDELKVINNFYSNEGHYKMNSNFGYFLYIFQSTKDDKKVIGKEYKSISQLYKFILDNFNLKSSFSIDPITLFFDNDKNFYLIMERYLNTSDLFNYYRRFMKNRDKSNKYLNLNILLITTTLFQTIQTFQIQKVPIIHYNLKPRDVLLSVNEYLNGKLLPVKYDFDIVKKLKMDYIYLPQINIREVPRDHLSTTTDIGANRYRTRALYSESSDLLSLAIILELMLKHRVSLTDLWSSENIIYISDPISDFIDKLYFQDANKIEGLEVIVNMLINAYQERKNNIFDIMDILTTREKLAPIVCNNFIDEEFLNKYFDIIDQLGVVMKFEPEFLEMAPKIFGPKFKSFLFTMFHQKGNQFKQEKFDQYEENMLEIYSRHKTDSNEISLMNEISEYHYQINFFNYKKKYDEIFKKYSIQTKSDDFSMKAKLFKILTGLDFDDNRSLNHFSNALNFSISSMSLEKENEYKFCFGVDYEYKIGFLLLHSIISTKKAIKTIKKKIKDCNFLGNDFIENDDDDEQIELDISFNISQFDLLNSSFSQLLSILHLEKTAEIEQECLEQFNFMRKNNAIQRKMFEFVNNNYGQDSFFLMFMHYLYNLELEDEKKRIESHFQHPNIFEVKKESKKNNENEVKEEEKQENEEEEEEERNSIVFKNIEEEKRKLIQELIYDNSYTFADQNEIELFKWLISFRFGDMLNGILSNETIDKLRNNFSFINFLKSLNITTFEFHIFLQDIFMKEKLVQFQKIVENYNLNNDDNSYSKNILLLESINQLSKNFFKIILSKFLNKEVENKELKFLNDHFLNLFFSALLKEKMARDDC